MSKTVFIEDMSLLELIEHKKEVEQLIESWGKESNKTYTIM